MKSFRRLFTPPFLAVSIYKFFVTYVSFPNFSFTRMHFCFGGRRGNVIGRETEMTSFKLNYTRFSRFSTFFGLIRRMRWSGLFGVLEDILRRTEKFG